jgi:hypothetical protein
MEDFGDLRCIFCKQRLPVNEYPWVGAIFQCIDCRGYQIIQAHYLEIDGTVTMAVSNVPKWILRRLNKILAENR